MRLEAKPYLKRIEVIRHTAIDEFPFSIPSLSQLESLDFHQDVTFFVGENGSGKSTLLEAIAEVIGINPEGGNKNTIFSTQNTHSSLASQIKAIKSFQKPQDYYFLRAESFYNVATYMDQVSHPIEQGYGGLSLHEQSHGESFMATLINKLHGRGLYLMDEPEAALSPAKQMAAISMIDKLVKQKSQLIIATHSPILLAYPNAKIYQFNEDGITAIEYEDTEHYQITKSFLNKHKQMIDILTKDT